MKVVIECSDVCACGTSFQPDVLTEAHDSRRDGSCLPGRHSPSHSLEIERRHSHSPGTLRGTLTECFQGERVSPSMCGRMDQCCAFGDVPTLMTFDGDVVCLHIHSLTNPTPSTTDTRSLMLRPDPDTHILYTLTGQLRLAGPHEAFGSRGAVSLRRRRPPRL